jgi:hypothetical protein
MKKNPPHAKHANDNLFGSHFLANILFISNETFRCLGKKIAKKEPKGPNMILF